MFDFQLIHGWGGAYAKPLTFKAKAYVCECEDFGPFQIEPDGTLCCDHRDAMDLAQTLKDMGFRFAGMEILQ